MDGQMMDKQWMMDETNEWMVVDEQIGGADQLMGVVARGWMDGWTQKNEQFVDEQVVVK